MSFRVLFSDKNNINNKIKQNNIEESRRVLRLLSKKSEKEQLNNEIQKNLANQFVGCVKKLIFWLLVITYSLTSNIIVKHTSYHIFTYSGVKITALSLFGWRKLRLAGASLNDTKRNFTSFPSHKNGTLLKHWQLIQTRSEVYSC